MSDAPLLDGTYEELVSDFLRWQRRAKIAATIAVIAGLLSIALGAVALLRGENTRTIVQSPEGVPCANPTSARCLTESIGVSRAIGFVEACRIVEAARVEAPSCVVARTGAGPSRPGREDRANPGTADEGPDANAGTDQGGGSEQAGTPSEQPDPPSGGSPGNGVGGADPDAGASPTGPGPSPEPDPQPPGSEHGGVAGAVDDAVDDVTDTSCDTAGDLGVNPPGVCR